MKYVLGILIVVLLIGLGRHFNMQELLGSIQRSGSWGPFVFIAAYVLACVLFLPGAILTLGAGALFGVFWGTAYVSLGSVLGATAAFLIGRYLVRDWVAKKIENNPKFKAISAAVTREGFKIVGLTRLSPIFPFNLLNYAYGVTGVRLRDYVIASWIGMLPGTVMYVYLGSLAGDLSKLISGGHTKTPFEWALYIVGLLAAVGVSLYVTHIARTALEKTRQGKPAGMKVN